MNACTAANTGISNYDLNLFHRLKPVEKLAAKGFVDSKESKVKLIFKSSQLLSTVHCQFVDAVVPAGTISSTVLVLVL
jgi:hypothetical protein